MAIDSVFSLGYRVLSAGLSYGLYLIIPLLFGVEELGSFGLFQAWLASLGVLAALGLNIFLLRLVSQHPSIRSVSHIYFLALSGAAAFAVAQAYGLVILGSMFGPFWSQTMGSLQSLKLLALSLPFQVVLLINVEVIRGMHQVKVSEVFRNLVAQLITVIVVVSAAWTSWLPGVGSPVVGLVVGTIVSALGSTLFITYRIVRSPVETKAASVQIKLRETLATSLPMMGGNLLQTWNTRAMTILLGFLVSKELVGIFSLAFKLSTLPDFVISAIKAPATPIISKLFWSNRWEELQRLLQSTVKVITITTVPITAILVIFSRSILGLAGEVFQEGAVTLGVLAMAQAASSLLGLTGAFLNMTNNHLTLLTVVALGAVCNLALGWTLIPHYGIHGAAVAYLVGTVLWNSLAAYFVKRKYDLRTFYHPFYTSKQWAL